MGTERAQWIGDNMSFYSANPLGTGSFLVHGTEQLGKDDAGFTRSKGRKEVYEQPNWWATDLLPKPLRHESYHHGSHTFITHEFITACLENRKPTVDIYEAIAYTAPGIIAHESALKGGQQLTIPQFD